MEFFELCSLIESLLFVKSSPISYEEIKNYFKMIEIDLNKNDIKKIIFQLQNKYMEKSSGIELLIINEEVQLITKKENFKYLSMMLSPLKKKTLTQSALETLTIIAYNQPVTKNFIEKIKGVKSDTTVNTLLEQGLIEIKGKLKQVGNPNLYSTTTKFLKYLNINSLEELPDYLELKNSKIQDNL